MDLSAADGVVRWLSEKGWGFPLGGGHVAPIVPAAVLFDLGRGPAVRAADQRCMGPAGLRGSCRRTGGHGFASVPERAPWPAASKADWAPPAWFWIPGSQWRR